MGAHPDDVGVRQVFADRLIELGDPWGDILALESAGKPDEARVLFETHREDLEGGLDSCFFSWEKGTLLCVNLQGPQPARQLATLLGMRAGCTLRALGLAKPVDREALALLARAPAVMKELQLPLRGLVDELWVPHVQTLSLRAPDVSTPFFPTLFEGDGLPSVHTLSLSTQNEPLDHAFLDQLFESALIPRLRTLRIWRGALNQRANQVFERHIDRLRHIENVELEFPDDLTPTMTHLFGRPVGLW